MSRPQGAYLASIYLGFCELAGPDGDGSVVDAVNDSAVLCNERGRNFTHNALCEEVIGQSQFASGVEEL